MKRTNAEEMFRAKVTDKGLSIRQLGGPDADITVHGCFSVITVCGSSINGEAAIQALVESFSEEHGLTVDGPRDGNGIWTFLGMEE